MRNKKARMPNNAQKVYDSVSSLRRSLAGTFELLRQASFWDTRVGATSTIEPAIRYSFGIKYLGHYDCCCCFVRNPSQEHFYEQASKPTIAYLCSNCESMLQMDSLKWQVKKISFMFVVVTFCVPTCESTISKSDAQTIYLPRKIPTGRESKHFFAQVLDASTDNGYKRSIHR